MRNVLANTLSFFQDDKKISTVQKETIKQSIIEIKYQYTQILSCLRGIDECDLTTAEKQIISILLDNDKIEIEKFLSTVVNLK